MADRARQNVLRRKAVAGRESAPASRVVLPAKALSSALIKAADAAMGLAVAARSVSERIASLPDLLELLPENGLMAVLEGPGDGQGLMAFDSGALSAVIEKQMTGAVASARPCPRRVTRTDAALCADLIDATLQRFETVLAGREDSRWAGGFGYASHVEDLRPLGLLLEEIDYRVFGLTLDFEMGAREGMILLALPAQGRGVVSVGAEGAAEDGPAKDADWAPGLERQVLQGEVQLDAVLHRFRLPISAIGDLRIGDEIPIPLSAIDDVRFRGAERIALGRCRLGSSKGCRAVRLGSTGAGEAAGQANAPAASFDLGQTMADLPTADALPELPDPGDDTGAIGSLPLLSGTDLPDLAATPLDLGPLGEDEHLPDIG